MCRHAVVAIAVAVSVIGQATAQRLLSSARESLTAPVRRRSRMRPSSSATAASSASGRGVAEDSRRRDARRRRGQDHHPRSRQRARPSRPRRQRAAGLRPDHPAARSSIRRFGVTTVYALGDDGVESVRVSEENNNGPLDSRAPVRIRGPRNRRYAPKRRAKRSPIAMRCASISSRRASARATAATTCARRCIRR